MSVGQVHGEPQQGCWSKHFKVEYKHVCLHGSVNHVNAEQTRKRIIPQTLFIQ